MDRRSFLKRTTAGIATAYAALSWKAPERSPDPEVTAPEIDPIGWAECRIDGQSFRVGEIIVDRPSSYLEIFVNAAEKRGTAHLIRRISKEVLVEMKLPDVCWHSRAILTEVSYGDEKISGIDVIRVAAILREEPCLD